MTNGTPHIRIAVENLRVSYDNSFSLAIDSVDRFGKIIAVLGHNGAGKSTLLKTILGLLPISEGRVQFFSPNEPRTPLNPEQHMAFCPENGSVFADITVESYVKLWCRIKHRDGDYYKKKGKFYIDMLQLGPLLKKRGRELSKGQRRRVQTAIGFLIEPRLFLFDEPFDGLDVQRSSELATIMNEQSAQRAFVLSSHRMDVVERLADLLIVLKEGKLLAAGGVSEVCRNLCSTSILIANMVDAAKIYQVLRKNLPGCLINHIGAQIIVNGDKIDVAALGSLIHQHDGGNVVLEQVQPSLVDAMNFHLRQVDVVNLN